MDKIRIITRNSKLALWQANFVKEQLQYYYPALIVEIMGITTRGDQILDRSLDKVGGKGLFIKELEKALAADTADIAVHSLKDLPAKLNAAFMLGAILKRDDAADAFVSNKYKNISSMPENAVIGTSSPRRIAIIKQNYPQLQIKLLRGNIQTRLKKLDDNEYDAIILAVAGLNRLDLSSRITQKLDMYEFLPAIAQGALAVEILSSRFDLLNFLRPLTDKDTELEVNIERELGSKLGANCSVPIAIHAQSIADEIHLNARVWDVDENKCCKSGVQVLKTKYGEGIDYCLKELLRQGAKQVMAKYE